MTLLIFIFVLVVLILVHEFGHFVVAKISGIRVDEFGIGFPPKLFGKKIGETEYTLNALPIGGFVRIYGENPTEEHYGDGPLNERSFVKKPRHIQALVLIAGVSMNIFLAFLLYTIAALIGIPTPVTNYEQAESLGLSDVHLYVSSVKPNSPAHEILKPSDIILGVYTENESLLPESKFSREAVSQLISESNGTSITVDLLRRNETMTVTLKPQQNVIEDEPERFAAGFSMNIAGIQQVSLFPAIAQGVNRTIYSLIDVVYGFFTLLRGIFTGDANLSEISGPVGIVGLVGDAAALGFSWLLTFTAYISLNLAIINLFPFPALDGGRLIFVGIESITQKPIKPVIAQTINMIGFIALLSLMFIVTVSDVLKLF